jgi:hypothetical protein
MTTVGPVHASIIESYGSVRLESSAQVLTHTQRRTAYSKFFTAGCSAGLMYCTVTRSDQWILGWLASLSRNYPLPAPVLQQGKFFQVVVWYLHTGARRYLPQRPVFDENVTDDAGRGGFPSDL